VDPPDPREADVPDATPEDASKLLTQSCAALGLQEFLLAQSTALLLRWAALARAFCLGPKLAQSALRADVKFFAEASTFA